MDLKTNAFQWYSLGFNIVLVDKNKRPLIEWAKWQAAKQTISEFEFLPWEKATKFAVVCGTKIKDEYLGAIDIDHPEAIPNFKIEQFAPTFYEQTPRGGYHIFFKSRKPIESIKFPNFELLGKGSLVIIYGEVIKSVRFSRA